MTTRRFTLWHSTPNTLRLPFVRHLFCACCRLPNVVFIRVLYGWMRRLRDILRGTGAGVLEDRNRSACVSNAEARPEYLSAFWLVIVIGRSSAIHPPITRAGRESLNEPGVKRPLVSKFVPNPLNYLLAEQASGSVCRFSPFVHVEMPEKLEPDPGSRYGCQSLRASLRNDNRGGTLPGDR